MKLVEPNEEEYAVCVNENNFAVFDLLYTEAGYKTVYGEPLTTFKNRYGYFTVHKQEKSIGFMATDLFTIYENKSYGLIELIRET